MQKASENFMEIRGTSAAALSASRMGSLLPSSAPSHMQHTSSGVYPSCSIPYTFTLNVTTTMGLTLLHSTQLQQSHQLLHAVEAYAALKSAYKVTQQQGALFEGHRLGGLRGGITFRRERQGAQAAHGTGRGMQDETWGRLTCL
jgi:hypothetical protein